MTAFNFRIFNLNDLKKKKKKTFCPSDKHTSFLICTQPFTTIIKYTTTSSILHAHTYTSATTNITHINTTTANTTYTPPPPSISHTLHHHHQYHIHTATNITYTLPPPPPSISHTHRHQYHIHSTTTTTINTTYTPPPISHTLHHHHQYHIHSTTTTNITYTPPSLSHPFTTNITYIHTPLPILSFTSRLQLFMTYYISTPKKLFIPGKCINYSSLEHSKGCQTILLNF